MYCFVLFDLPVVQEEDRKAANAFRQKLLKLGCTMFQYSVYTYLAESRDQIPAFVRKIEVMAPRGGSVSVISITMRQYEAMHQFSKTEKLAQKYEPIFIILI